MSKKIKIGVIGVIGATGNMGSEITKGLVKSGYQVFSYARSKDKLNELSKELGSELLVVEDSLSATIKKADMVLLPLPDKNVKAVAESIKDEVTGKVVVSISNPLSEDFSKLTTNWQTSAGEELAKLLPKAKVVKAFNTVFAGRINNPVINGINIDHFIAGDDQKAINLLEEVISDLGHNPIYVGGIEESRTLEHMAFVNISLSIKEKFSWNSAYKLLT